MNQAKLKLIASMFIFGTIGIFVRYIPLPSALIALCRGGIGAGFILCFVLLKKSKPDIVSIRKNFFLLALSGIFIGINWILLFESYRETTVATATLCYYMQPVFVILASPFFLKEQLSTKKICCVLVALLGMVFVSGIFDAAFFPKAKGILYGLGAALFYAAVVLMNKKIKNIHAYDKTIIQLGVGAVVLAPYVLLTQNITLSVMTPVSWFLLLFVGIVHTGIAYALYFDGMKDLPAQTIAIFSYIDPVVAIFLSALFLKEGMGIFGVIGAVLILGSTCISELPQKEKKKFS